MKSNKVPNLEEGNQKILALACGHIYIKQDVIPNIGLVCQVCQKPTIPPENLIITYIKKTIASNVQKKQQVIH